MTRSTTAKINKYRFVRARAKQKHHLIKSKSCSDERGQLSRDVNYSPTSSITLHGMIKVHSTCTEDGDSGGPLIMMTGQVQGTDTGSPNTHSCSVNYQTFDVYFQPIATTISRATNTLGHSVAMLTSHGRSAPTVSGFLCPNPADSGSHYYTCRYSSYDSQGATTTSWNSSSGGSSSSTELSDTCATGQVNVTLTLTNPYGTLHKYASFSCPTSPPP